MSELADLRRELDRWKDKYFTQSEAFDEEKGFAKEYASLLQRLIIRISLAAENVSDGLDAELEALRAAIRKASPSENDLEKRLKRIDKLILQSDESKQENASKVVASLEQLIDQLLQLKQLPRKQKSALKKLSKSIEKRAPSFQEYPGMLTEYAVVQAEVLREIVNDGDQEEGFLSRLFGGSAGAEDAKPPQDLSTESGSEVEVSLVDADLELVEDHAEVIPEEEFVPGFASISGHVTSTLNNLLDQLVFPKSAERDLRRLREKVASKLNWYELGPTLDDLSNLVLAVVGKGQREFETFLVVLDERLEFVQSYLANSQEADSAWFEKTKVFGDTMRTEVSELSRELSLHEDIEGLKSSITSHIDTISSVMTQFSLDGDAYEQVKADEVKELKERIKSMEEESARMHVRLQEERQKALKDKLTGLPNREAYDEQFELELARVQRYKTPATLVVADVDHFKSVNDKYGHLSGDKVLQIIAKELRNRIRKTDFVARYGGEEFAVILPETDIDIAKNVIEKTREMIGRLPFHFKDERVQITMSFGLVAFEEGADKGMLFERADQALYRAKENGRNRVELADNN